jgi:hypothetical protein
MTLNEPTTRSSRLVCPSVYDWSFAAAAAHCGVDPATLRRWHQRGVSTARGRVRLDALRKGGAYYTSRAAVDDFLASCNPAPGPPPAPGDGADGPAPDADRLRGSQARSAAAMTECRRLYGV